MVDARARAHNLQMTDHFAEVYERTAHRITEPVSAMALELTGDVRGRHVLDIAAGAGALSNQAARLGAAVTAVDIAPGMVRRLHARLKDYAGCEAREMNGEALELPDEFFEMSFSVFGAITFADWRGGLREQARVTRKGGAGCVVTWREPPGGGPFQVLVAALRAVFPDRPRPPWPEGFVALSDPGRLKAEMVSAGFGDIAIHEREASWEGRVGQAYLDEMRDLHRYIPPYAALAEEDRRRVDGAIVALTREWSANGRLQLVSPVLIAVARRLT